MEYLFIGIVVWLFWPKKAPFIPPVVIGLGENNDPDEPQPQGPTPAQVLQTLVSATPRPGRFYQIVQNGPNASGDQGVLAQALNSVSPGRGSNGQLRLALLDHMTRGWNLQLYGRNITTDTWPALYMFRGENIGTAWLPRHANAVAEMVAGRMPQRTITDAGAKIGDGSSFGLIWIPELEEDQLQQAASVVIKQRPDGSDPYMPPPELLSLLAA